VSFVRIYKIMLIVLVLCVVGALSISCGSESDSAAVTEEQVVTVQRGDLTVDITAVGNLAFSHQEEMKFDVEGTIGEILVEVGDQVEEDQVLAKLDDVSITSLELELPQAEAAVADAKVALEAAEEALEDAEEPYSDSEIAQAELDVVNAEITLDRAQESYERAYDKYVGNRTVEEWAQAYEQKKAELTVAEFSLADAEEALAEMKAGADPLEVEQKQKQLAVAQASLKEAESTLDEAIERLEEATMVAPFAGIIISVDAEEGDEVDSKQVIIEMVDPEKFEVEVLVGEMDISGVQVGTQAIIQVDAFSGISLPAEVTYISPTATIQQGVVNYTVEVEIQSLQAMVQERQEARQETMLDISAEDIAERVQQAVEQGLITQEQAEEMLKQGQKGQAPFQQGGESLPRRISEEFQLKEGLTVTVSIIVEERNDVLLVPNSAITSSGRQNYVKVVLPNGISENRLVTTGISDWQYTEIVEGLNEGDEIVVPQGTATTSTTQQGQQNRMFVPGVRK